VHENLSLLADLEKHGLEVAKGQHLVHCDLYPHNILLTEESVYFVDWPHARQVRRTWMC
jgi:RIO-like serine/threonine protein kinase